MNIFRLFPCLTALLLFSCTPSFTPADLKEGDLCAKCGQAIIQKNMAGEIMFEGGEAMKFDDLGCLVAFHFGIDSATAHGVFVQDYSQSGWIPEEEAVVLMSSAIVTPAHFNSVAFRTASDAERERRSSGGNTVPLPDVLKLSSLPAAPLIP